MPSTEGTGRILLWPQPETQVTRQYIVIPYSVRGTAGPPSPPLAVPLVPAPPAPPAPAVTHDATSFTLTWATPPGAQMPIQPTVTEAAYKEAITAKKEDALLPARPLVLYGTPQSYRVYEVPAPGATSPPPAAPVNTTAIETTTFSDPRMAFGVARCYALRTVEKRGPITIESVLSPSTCVTAVDTYPPPAPTGLVAVGSGGGVSLIWEPVTAPDLLGYLVLRGVEGEALKPITETPVTEATYRDTSAPAGVMYIYAVVAVDTVDAGKREPGKQPGTRERQVGRSLRATGYASRQPAARSLPSQETMANIYRTPIGYVVEDGGAHHALDGDLFGDWRRGAAVDAPTVMLAPVVPSKIVCIGLNYKDHAAEQGKPLPAEPLIFLKPSSAIVNPGEAIELPRASVASTTSLRSRS